MECDTLSIDTIEKSVELDLKYPSVSERYFSHYFFVPKNPYKRTMIKPKHLIDKKDETDDGDVAMKKNAIVPEDPFIPTGEDTCILVHSNRICVVTLSVRHPVIVQKKKITKINFNVNGVDRLANKVSGKGKRGAQIVGLFSPLLSLECSDGSVYTVFFGVMGKLIEINERLVENPNLILEAPMAEGYLAVVLPKLTQNVGIKDMLLPRQEYQQLYQDLL